MIVTHTQQQLAPLRPEDVRQAALAHYLQQVAEAVHQPGASRLEHYFVRVRPDCLNPEGYAMPSYFHEVRERWRRQGLTELRTGVHWGAEERDRLLGPARRPPDQRVCVHCEQRGMPGLAETTCHIVFDCALYRDLRPLFPDLFPAGQPQQETASLADFFAGPDRPLACYAGACRRRGRRALGLPT